MKLFSLGIVSLLVYSTLANPHRQGHGSRHNRISRDATCGGKNGYTCEGSGFGDCCSKWGWCGSTAEYCGKHCQEEFGSCLQGKDDSPSPPAGVSYDRCGPHHEGLKCADSLCCSEYGWCGKTDEHCQSPTLHASRNTRDITSHGQLDCHVLKWAGWYYQPFGLS